MVRFTVVRNFITDRLMSPLLIDLNGAEQHVAYFIYEL
jgi:hypothetical protein